MKSLYSRLFRYGEREGHSPLENFLTEVLCDLFNRLSDTETVAFLQWALKDTANVDAWPTVIGQPLQWTTQVYVEGGIADLVLWIANKPALVVENKTWSTIRQHSSDSGRTTQLTTYCAWLAARAESHRPKAMLLLTGTAAAPQGFSSGEYHSIEARAQITWAGLARWLKYQISVGEPSSEVWHALAADLIIFLKEKKLTSEIFTSSDVASANLMLPTMERWHATFRMLWDATKESCSTFLNPRISQLVFHTEGGLLWQWRFGTVRKTPRQSWVAFALRFPELSQWYGDAGLPAHPHFLLLIGSDGNSLPTEKLRRMPDGWLEYEGEFLLAKPIHELPAEVDARMSALGAWAEKGMQQAKIILSSLVDL